MTARAVEVTASDQFAGRLEQNGPARYSFAYRSDDPACQVSLTMPLRTASYEYPQLHPVFAQNLPEGYLRDIISRTVSKLHGASELALLASLGPYQIGRLGYRHAGETTRTPTSPEKLDTLLDSDNPDLFAELVDKYALRSGISGVQPKLLVEVMADPPRHKAAIRSGGLIVKSWGDDFPDLALNEYFCLRLARRAGLPVPRFEVSRDGRLFVMERFDVCADGHYAGFEDGCVLQGLSPAEKYDSTYERLARSVRDFVSPMRCQSALASLFRSVVVSWAVQNGDAHLKNFGVLYDAPGATVDLAPTYDIVTTTAYLRHDVPALHLAGSKRWWPPRTLLAFGTTHCSLKPAQARSVLSEVAAALQAELPHLEAAAPRFPDVAVAMCEAWQSSLVTLNRAL